MKQTMEADFDVQVREGHVEVIFRPTESHISFGILVDPKDIARLGRLSRSANVRHAKTGDTGDYSASEVEAVAAASEIRSECCDQAAAITNADGPI